MCLGDLFYITSLITIHHRPMCYFSLLFEFKLLSIRLIHQNPDGGSETPSEVGRCVNSLKTDIRQSVQLSMEDCTLCRLKPTCLQNET